MNIQLSYPGIPPGEPASILNKQHAILENNALSYKWERGEQHVDKLIIENKQTAQNLDFENGFFPKIVFSNNETINLNQCNLNISDEQKSDQLSFSFNDDSIGIHINFEAKLLKSLNAIIHTLTIHALKDLHIEDLIFFNTAIENAEQIGEVMGSVIVCGNIFLGIEHPLANNKTSSKGLVQCSLPQGNILKKGSSWSHTFGIGVTPPNQLRRGFAYYIDQRRAHPYRPFLHYNNWYDVWLGKPVEQRMTESESIEAIHYFGKELVQKRNVNVHAVVWDDGWDDFRKSLWEFHSGFPDGFKKLMEVAKEYNIDQGVWMSPNGGYAYAKDARIAHCKPLGYEVNETGFSMGGPNYYKAYLNACLKMIRENGVVFFKFDGMGDGGHNSGEEIKLSDDINGVLNISRELRKEKQDIYISATAGTWASPYWLLYADSIWRQGSDSDHHGTGDSRQSWITYRDMFTYNRVVKAGPLYPLNSLMLHGILIGNRPGRAPAGMAMDDKSLADEAWTFFGSGTCLQELYISPDVPTDQMLDSIADAANWAHENAHILIDSHWIGGSPEFEEVYGWASWQSNKGFLIIRNPSDKEQVFSTTLRDALELTDNISKPMVLKSVYSQGCQIPSEMVDIELSIEFNLKPWEVVVLEITPS